MVVGTGTGGDGASCPAPAEVLTSSPGALGERSAARGARLDGPAAQGLDGDARGDGTDGADHGVEVTDRALKRAGRLGLAAVPANYRN